MRILGLTGGIACGKSTVSRILTDYYSPLGVFGVVDVDLLAKEAVAPQQPLKPSALTEIVRLLGPQALLADGTLNRPWVAAQVFGDPRTRAKYDAILQPYVMRLVVHRLVALASNQVTCAVIDSALLFDSGLDFWCERVWTVECDPDLQLQRLMARNGLPEQEARQRIDAQMPAQERQAKSQQVLWNNGTREDLEQTTRQAAHAWNDDVMAKWT